MPKAKQKTVSVEEEGDDPQGVVNPLEAKSHVCSLDQVMALIQERVKAGNTKDHMERAIEGIKTMLANMIQTMQ